MAKLHGVLVNQAMVGKKILILTSSLRYFTAGKEYEVKRVDEAEDVGVLDNDKDINELFDIDDDSHNYTWEWVGPRPASTKAQRKTAAEYIRAAQEDLEESIAEAQKLGMTVVGDTPKLVIYFQPQPPRKEHY